MATKFISPLKRVLFQGGPGLTRKWGQGVLVLMTVTFGRYGLNFLTQIALARLLLQADFGRFALALTLVTGFSSLASLSTDRYLVKVDSWCERRFGVAFTGELILSALFFVFAILGAPWLLGLWGRPEVSGYVQLLAVIILLDPINSARSVLQRNFNYGRMWWPTLTGVFAGSVVSIVLAYSGMGAWGLVVGRVTSATCESLLLWRLLPTKPKLMLDRGILAEIWRFGWPITGAGFLVFIYWHVDYLIVDKLLGPIALGTYYMAFQLTQHLLQLRTGLAHVAYPIFARQSVSDRADTFGKFTWVNAILYLYVTAVILGVGDTLVTTVLGEKWAPAVTPLKILVVLTAWRGISGYFESIMLLSNGGRFLFTLTLMNCFLLPAITIPLTVTYGVNGAATGVAVAVLGMAPILVHSVTRRLEGRARLFDILRGPVLACVVATLVMSWIKTYGFVWAVLVGSVSFLGSLALVDRVRFSELLEKRGRWLTGGSDVCTSPDT